MPNALKDHGLLIEALTRARKTVVCVTHPDSCFNELFQSAVNHNDAQNCDLTGSDSCCPYICQTRLLAKDKVSFFGSESTETYPETVWYLWC